MPLSHREEIVARTLVRTSVLPTDAMPMLVMGKSELPEMMMPPIYTTPDIPALNQAR
jgi:hypothetical protein